MKKILLIILFLLVKQNAGFSQNYVLYGVTTYGGGVGQLGVLFCYEPYGDRLVILKDFYNTGCGEPLGCNLIQDTVSDNIYGITRLGGTFGNGAIFRYDPNTNIDTTIYSFNTPNGILPNGSPIIASNGLLYGMTSYFNTYNGVFFSFNPNSYTYTDIFSFDTTDGAAPGFCQPFQASDSMVYGMTESGGFDNNGVLFRYNPNTNIDTVVVFFNSLNGSVPYGSVMQASNGLIYGMTAGGGTDNYGVFFSYNPITLKDTVLYNFTGSPGGFYPQSDLYQASNGIIYAIVPSTGGFAGIFSFNPTTFEDTVMLLHHGESLLSPNSNNDLIQDPDDGLLYGTSSGGGDSSSGTLFSFNPVTFKDSVLVNFHQYSSGQTPVGRLLLSKSIPIDTTTAIRKLTSEAGIVNIYPNPNNGIFTITLSNPEFARPADLSRWVSASQTKIEIYNVMGEQVYNATLKQVQGDNIIHLIDQPNGIYFYRVIKETGELIGSGKVIIAQ